MKHLVGTLGTMDRRTKGRLLAAAVALFITTVTGIGNLEAGKTALGWFMVGGSGVAWVVLVVRWRQLRRSA